MKNIKALFNALQEKNQGHGAYISLTGAVEWRGYARDVISRNFTELVPKEDYANRERPSLIDQLVVRTKPIEEHVLEGVKAPKKSAKSKVVELHQEGSSGSSSEKISNSYYCEND